MPAKIQIGRSIILGLLFLLIVLLTTYRAAPPEMVYATELAGSPLAVVINEVAWMGTTASANDEWIELVNTSPSPIDLSGWTLSALDGTPTIALSGSIPGGGHFLLERTDDNSVPGVPADLIFTGGLGNDGEFLILQDETSTIIDEVDSSSGWLAGHADARVPMNRVDTAVSGSEPDNWTYNPRCGSATNSSGVSRTCTLTETMIGSDLNYNIYFNELAPEATVTTTVQTTMESALLGLIENATTTIDIALYGLNRQSVVNALIAAHSRGVTVRVVGDDEAATVSYSAHYQSLTNAGITVVIDASLSTIQHNKFLVVDGQTVWTGSTNFTDTGFSLNTNNSIAITDTLLANIYTAEFEEMWAGTFQGSKLDNTGHLFDFNGTLVESYFSPTDLVAFEVWEELSQADETIHFAMFFWTDDLLAEQVIAQMESGVEVYGVWDKLGAASSSSVDEALCAAGAHIGIEDSEGKLHHKFAIIDINGEDPTVVLGSFNWTNSGAYSNDENTLIIHDAELAQAYFAEWQRLWNAMELDDICNPDAVFLPLIIR